MSRSCYLRPDPPLVTRAFSGTGAVCPDPLVQRGYGLISVARHVAWLTDLARRLHAETSRTIAVLLADLGSPAEPGAVADRLAAALTVTLPANVAGNILSVAS